MKEEIISLKNISKTFVQSSFDGTVNFKALDEISLTVFKGESILISGANGSGKTLLMSIISGLIRPSSGLVEVKERCGIVGENRLKGYAVLFFPLLVGRRKEAALRCRNFSDEVSRNHL